MPLSPDTSLGRGTLVGRNTQPGLVRAAGVNRTSQIVTTIVPAGQSIPIFQAGKEFYLVIATGPVFIKPNNGSENQYTQGTGQIVDDTNLFNQLQVRNATANNIVIQIFVGFGGYIDNRTILFDPLIVNAVNPTSPVVNSQNQISIPDLSGGSFVDINGVTWLALQRLGIYVSNYDPATIYGVEDLAGIVGVAVAVHPKTDIVFPAAGNFRIKVPAGNVNAVVSEIYSAVAPS